MAGTQGGGQEGLSPRPRDSRELGAPASREAQVLHHRGTCSHSPALELTEGCIHLPAPVPPKLPAEPGEPPGAVPREMAVVPGLSISITGLPPHPTPRTGNCQDTVYTPENMRFHTEDTEGGPVSVPRATARLRPGRWFSRL